MGCTGGWSCAGGYAGCTGGFAGCVGGPVYGAPVIGGPGVEMKKEELKEEIAAPATLVVKLPAEARLTIDGNPTASTSDVRTFRTPNLPAGREFHYTLQAEVMNNGKPVMMTKTVAVRAGAESQITFDAAELAAVASR